MVRRCVIVTAPWEQDSLPEARLHAGSCDHPLPVLFLLRTMMMLLLPSDRPQTPGDRLLLTHLLLALFFFSHFPPSPFRCLPVVGSCFGAKCWSLTAHYRMEDVSCLLPVHCFYGKFVINSHALTCLTSQGFHAISSPRGASGSSHLASEFCVSPSRNGDAMMR